MNTIKNTSYSYGTEYQSAQVQKYKNRENNHWKHRVSLFNKLIKQVTESRFKNTPKSEILIADIGCSIGTFALEASKQGYNSVGIDFDKTAIDIAEQLAEEENLNTRFICSDVAESLETEKIDIAVCFDIFEHLHDDEMGALLNTLKMKLSDNGAIIYHTYPTQYDYIFYQNRFAFLPLVPFSVFGKSFFEKTVKIHASITDIFLLLFKGVTYKEHIKKASHCNPTTKQRLTDVIARNGFENEYIEVSQLYDFKKRIQKIFRKQPVSYRNIYGIATVKKQNV
jgi:2-polyprenyl-3-methyl-5-hydroxy-6-metoxy-1,4-benzoquinol methylase